MECVTAGKSRFLGHPSKYPCLRGEKVVTSVALWQQLEKALHFYSSEIHICGEQTDKINKQRKKGRGGID